VVSGWPAGQYRKSSYSDTTHAECVEVAHSGTSVHVRDSTNPAGPVLTVPTAAWAAFIGAVCGGEFPTLR
jgi:Domain of unknown function (DUF397)